MKKKNRKNFYIAICMLVSFALWTVLVCFLDVAAIGPQGSSVGFSTINKAVHEYTGVCMPLYVVTDWLGFVPLCIVVGFALLGLSQWISLKSLKKVDYSIFVLGGFYAVVMAVYVLFEIAVVNYRPILINGCLEASYPSSTTVLAMCVMPTAMMQLNQRLKCKLFKQCLSVIIIAFTTFMVVGRIISGVHWFTDIVGGALFSTGVVYMYAFIVNFKNTDS